MGDLKVALLFVNIKAYEYKIESRNIKNEP